MAKKWRKRPKDGMIRRILQLCRMNKKQMTMTMAKLKSLQICLNRKTMRMEPAEQLQDWNGF